MPPYKGRTVSDQVRSEEGLFAIVPVRLLGDEQVPDRAIRVYATIASFADAASHETFAGQEAFAQRQRCSVRTIQRGIRDLLDAGWLRSQARKHKGRKVGTIWTVVRRNGDDSFGDSSDATGPAISDQADPTVPVSPDLTACGGSSSFTDQGTDQREPATPAQTPDLSLDARARAVTQRVFRDRDPKPGNGFPAVLGVARKMLKVGWDDERLYAAMLAVPTISVGWLEGELNKRNGKQSPTDTQAMIDARFFSGAER